jgi:GxxExxY protein
MIKNYNLAINSDKILLMIKLSHFLFEIKGVGPKFSERLKKLKIETVKDLLWHFPFRYEDFSRISKIADLKIGETATISGVISDIKLHRTWKRKMFIVEALIADDTGSIKAVWFNQRFLLSILKKGKRVNLAGKVVEDPEGGICLSHPIYELINQRQSAYSSASISETRHTGRLVPIYPETKKVTSKILRYLIKSVLDHLEKIEEPIPQEVLNNFNFPEINQALKQIHFPENLKQAQLAKKRFAFEDLFLLQLANLRQRLKLAQQKAYAIKIEIDEVKKLIARLPFELTKSQKVALWEILKDLNKNQPMNRLLQGDVGSGKTIVAILAALLVVKENKQVAFMAPTEVLARQHYFTFKKFFSDFDRGVALLTSSAAKIFYGDNLETEIKKAELAKKIAAGEIKIIIGTHALIQKNITFKDLALVIIDEQHRFGVAQRASLVGRRLTQIDTQINADQKDYFLYKDLTYNIRGAIFNVYNKIGPGQKENVYAKALELELKIRDIKFEREKTIPVNYLEEKIGVYKPDFVIEDKIILEVKALPFVRKIEERQLWNYLKGSNYKLALLVNFGNQKLDIRRVIYDQSRNLRESASNLRESALMLPHLLSMSATPIPRTLSLTIFGDLDLSIIDELPKGRKEVITKIVAPANRDKAYAFIRNQVKKGRQVFVICPWIESQTNADYTQTNAEVNKAQTNAEKSQRGSVFSPRESAFSPRESTLLLETKAVKEEYEKLSKKVFPDLKVAMLHGKMKAKEKAKIMDDFKNGKIDVLVSTSVVEVGVDVPNATIMMIEGSERFGLAQLYQFRGRVGRGEHQSFCFLFTDSSAKTTYRRLYSLLEAKNGFELAEKDLEIRGPGEILGESQTGMPDLAMKAIQNKELVKISRQAAETILKNDPELKKYPLLQKRLEGFEKEIHLE